MRVGILTGGGDCPGLNAVIRAAVRKGIFHHNDEFVGFIEGWRGVVENKTMPLTIDTVSGILVRAAPSFVPRARIRAKWEAVLKSAWPVLRPTSSMPSSPSEEMILKVWPMPWCKKESR